MKVERSVCRGAIIPSIIITSDLAPLGLVGEIFFLNGTKEEKKDFSHLWS
jgi:hypothetical protein